MICDVFCKPLLLVGSTVMRNASWFGRMLELAMRPSNRLVIRIASRTFTVSLGQLGSTRTAPRDALVVMAA